MKYVRELKTIITNKILIAHPDVFALILMAGTRVTTAKWGQLTHLKAHTANKTSWSATYVMISWYMQIEKFIRLADDREVTYLIQNVAVGNEID